MKKYNAPEIEVINLDNLDIIRTSIGTETSKRDEADGIWDFEIG